MQSLLQLLPYGIALLPFIAFGASYYLQRPTPATNTPEQNTVIMRRNAAISGTSILIVAIITALAQGKLTGNAVVDVGYVLTLATTLQVETFRPLQGYLRGDPPAQQMPPLPGQIRSVDPKPIRLPDKPL